MKDELLKLALMWERHAREYVADVEDAGNGLSDELRQDHRVREAMCNHHALQLRAILAAQHAGARGGGVERPSTHHVHRGPESLPCYCAGTTDHTIGNETEPPTAAVELCPHKRTMAQVCDPCARYPFTTDSGREDADLADRMEREASALIVTKGRVPQSSDVALLREGAAAIRRLTPAGGEDGGAWIAGYMQGANDHADCALDQVELRDDAMRGWEHEATQRAAAPGASHESR